MKVKRAGPLTKIVVVSLLIMLTFMLLDLRGQLAEVQERKADLERQVALQTQTNANLRDAVENSGDPERQKNIARSNLGLVEPGERVFRITD